MESNMNNEQNIQKMKNALEQLRAEKYPNIPSDLLDELLNELAEDMSNQEKAQIGVKDVLINYFSSK